MNRPEDYHYIPPPIPIQGSYDDRVGGQSVANIFDRLVQDRKTAPFNYYLNTSTLSLMEKLRLPERFTMIDAACGNGDLLARVGEEFHPRAARLVGFDISREMVRISQKRYPNITIVLSDLRKPALHHESADIVTCINGIHYLPTLEDVETAYLASFSLLRPGGYFIVGTEDEESIASWRLGITEVEFQKMLSSGQRVVDWSMPDRDGQAAFRMKFYAYSHDEHQTSLRKAGFPEIQMYRTLQPIVDMVEYSPQAYQILRDKPVFVFFVAQKPL